MNLFIIFKQNIHAVQQKRPNQEPPIDLVKDFYNQDIDHKALEKALTHRKNTAKGFTNFSLKPYNGGFGDVQKKHLLNRTMVGFCNRHYKDLEGLNIDQAIDLIFTKDTMQEPKNNYYWVLSKEEYKEKYISEDVEPNQPFIDRPYLSYPGNREYLGDERRRAFFSSIYENIYNQKTSIHWRLFLFLHNLVPSKFDNFLGHKGMFNYTKLVFDSCFSSYKDFIYNVTFDGSMLYYLNLARSTKEKPDENYAREIQELFTVGKRPFAKFTEQDVREAARLLVGCGVDFGITVLGEGHENTPIFNSSNHDTGDKQFSPFYDNKIIRGREGDEGIEEVKEFVDMLCQTEENSIYIVRRLYQFFVYPSLTEDIEELIIKPLSKIYKENNFSLIEPLKVLLKSEHFYLNNIENSLIKSPIEFVIGIIKETDLYNKGILYANDGPKLYNSIFNYNFFGEKEKDASHIKYNLGESIKYNLEQLGMGLLAPPSVSGWPSYYQEPVYDLFWLNSSTFTGRLNFIEYFTGNGIWLDSVVNEIQVSFKPDIIEYLNSYSDPFDITSFTNEMVFRLLGGEPSTSTLLSLKQALLGGNSEDHWKEELERILSTNNPDESSYYSVSWRIQAAFSVMATSGEFHLF